MPAKKTYTKEQQKANRAKWVAALRSGEYKQGNGCLRNPQSEFCCLGVAVDLALKEGVIRKGRWTHQTLFESEQYPYEVRFESRRGGRYMRTESGVLPESVRNWLGLKHEQGTYEHESNPEEDRCLTNDNDTRLLDFEKIAQIIEAEPKGLIAD